MKTAFDLAPVALAVVLLAGCRTQPPHSGPRAIATGPEVNYIKSYPAIPARPEALQFPPFHFQPPHAATYRVPLTSGPVAYVAEDRELPLVTITLSVHTGDWVEPPGKEGLTDLCGQLLTRAGTAHRTAQELDERLAFLAANLSSSMGGAQGSVTLNLLSKDLDEGLAILREVLTQPRFQEDRLALYKQQSLQTMKQRNDESANIERLETGYLAYGEQFWDNRNATAASLASVTREDLLAFHRRWFFPSNFVVAASGDFDRATLVTKLEQLFAHWPWTDAPPPPIPQAVTMAPAGIYLMDKDVNQGRVTLLLPGIMRDNPDYFPILIMNEIFGGGGFTARIVNRVRSDEGLAYAVGSSFPGGVYFPSCFRASFQSKSRTVAYALSLIIEEMKRMAAEPVSTEELENAKSGFIDRLPRSFASKSQIVGMLAGEEFTGRYQTDPDFWQHVAAKVRAVTKADVQRVAQQYLTPDRLVILIVGDKAEILKGHPNHAVKLESLGTIHDRPLRDPLTLEPLHQ
ncbi:MAG TPA: pitrilysin family protein [Verrucomicrobiota bacterium]|nr:pitrilysin family protein [Verrucomicrobiota bacterium]HNT15971.1 pitrilysin family protein [Verrucomicrobiota bacterium]